MERQQFIDTLQQEGYADPVLVERAPNAVLGDHAHPFEAKALILEGEIHIAASGIPERRYGPGEVFHLRRDEAHTERYGPQGVKYLSGRR